MKRGIHTSEFWVTALVCAGAVAADVGDALPDKYASIVVAISAGLYAVSRGLAKSGS